MPSADTTLTPTTGMTPRELARYLRVGVTKVLTWIHRGELGAVSTASVQCGRPRYVVLPHHLAAWERGRQAGPPPRPARRRKRTEIVDYFPD
jgi:hypothetical protein